MLDDSNGVIRFVIRGLEKNLGFCLYYPGKNYRFAHFQKKYAFPEFHNGNIQVECVNTKKILSFLATLSDSESKAYKQDEKQVSQPIALAGVTSVLELETNHQEVLEDVETDVRTL